MDMLGIIVAAAADDIACVESESPAAAVGVMAMKYAFSPEGFKAAIPNVETILRKMPSVEELQMAWKSIGQRMGFVSAGDARRAAEKAGREEGLKKGLEKGRKEGFDDALDAMRKLGIPEEKC